MASSTQAAVAAAPPPPLPPSEAHKDRCLATLAEYIGEYIRRDRPADFPLPHHVLVCIGHPEPLAIVVFCNAAQFAYKLRGAVIKTRKVAGSDEEVERREKNAMRLNHVDYEIVWKETDVPTEWMECQEERFPALFDERGELRINNVLFVDLELWAEEEKVKEEKEAWKKGKNAAKKMRRAEEKAKVLEK